MTLAIIFLLGGFLLSHAAGTASDPLITLSYLNQKFGEAVGKQTDPVFKPLVDQIADKLTAKQSAVKKNISQNGLIQAMAAQYIERAGGVRSGFSSGFTSFSLKKGDKITGAAGTGLILCTGSAQVSGGTGKVAVNVTKGTEVKAGAAAARNQRFLLLADDGSGFIVTSDTATVAVDGGWYLSPAYSFQYYDLAEALNQMKLFLGTPTGYNLDRSATRLESLVMMLRLFGEEEEALAYTGGTPFTDLPDWGRPYVGYAFSKGYTKGTSEKKFTPNGVITPEQYMTFVLRALGYSDTGGDFVWSKSLSFATESKLFSAAEINLIRNPFYRDQMVYLSYYALSGRLKDGSGTLLSRLTANGAVSSARASSAMDKVKRVRP